MKRKPKGFDFRAFSEAIEEIADACPVEQVASKHVA
jgi:hypothetical protein